MSTKILTVDDSQVVRLTVAKALKLCDCTLLEADNGALGLSLASREKPDTILLDYNMPIMDGFEVLTRLRSDPDLKATPVIMMTSLSDRETVTKIARLGVRDYLVKPFNEELLLQRLGRVVPLKSRAESGLGAKRYDAPINILVVDDKPAIVEQIRLGLAGTPWKVTSAGQPAQALDLCVANGIDLVLASLSLPNDGAYTLFQNLRSYANTSTIPVFGLCVKTTVGDQTRATQAGFAGIVTKPIQAEDLKVKISRALKLNTSYKYFQQRPEALVLILPKDINPGLQREVVSDLSNQLTALVDAGGDKLIVDFSAVPAVTLPLIQLVLAVIQASAEFSIRYAMVGPEALREQCRMYEESKAWSFGGTFEEAVALLQQAPNGAETSAS
ncbi:MAG: response regulator [Verrucomicrobiota bacterium]|jgi:two-component system cell cycle response regulator